MIQLNALLSGFGVCCVSYSHIGRSFSTTIEIRKHENFVLHPHRHKKKLAALSMLHKAKKAYYACNRVAARTGCAVHAPCLLAVRQLP